MKTLNVPRQFTRFLSVFSLLFIFSSSANAAIFVKFDGVDGEATDAQHDKWSDVLSVSEGLRQPDSGATGTTRRRGDVIFDNIAISKELDKASVKLREAVALGKVFPQVDIHVTANFGGGRETYFRYELKNVLITSFSMNASGNDAPPVENVTFNFEEIKVTYTERDDSGSPLGNVEFTWNVERGER